MSRSLCKKGLEKSTPLPGGGLNVDIVYILTLPDKDSIKIWQWWPHTECGHCAYFDFDIARQRFQKYDDDDPRGWVGWTECGHCALFQLCGAASHRQPKLVSARHACKMMMTMMMIMTTAMSMTVHVLKVNNLQQMLNQKYLLYKVITSNQSWQRKYRVGRWFLNGFHFLIFYLAHSLCWNGCDQCSTHQSFFGRFRHLKMICRSDPPSTQ